MNHLEFQIQSIELELESVDSEQIIIQGNINSLKTQIKQLELKKVQLINQLGYLKKEEANLDIEEGKVVATEVATGKSRKLLKTDD